MFLLTVHVRMMRMITGKGTDTETASGSNQYVAKATLLHECKTTLNVS